MLPCQKCLTKMLQVCDDAYGNDAPPCASVEIGSALQKITEEIAAISVDLDCHMYHQFTHEMYVELRRRLRKLSALGYQTFNR